jgi:hypothetical protein
MRIHLGDRGAIGAHAALTATGMGSSAAEVASAKKIPARSLVKRRRGKSAFLEQACARPIPVVDTDNFERQDDETALSSTGRQYFNCKREQYVCNCLVQLTAYFKYQQVQAMLFSRSSSASPSMGLVKNPNAPLCR